MAPEAHAWHYAELPPHTERLGKLLTEIPVIDLFAGPGGLGEGFSSFDGHPKLRFRLGLSVEKDPVAHRTLLMRAFFRQFDRAPESYYSRLRAEITSDELFGRFPEKHAAAAREAVCLELGRSTHSDVDSRILSALSENGDKPWLLIGGPPCQAYSIVGRARMRPGDRAAFEKDHRHFLYREYLRIVREHRPTAFVMENVKGILSSSIAGELIFQRILEDFSDAGYEVHSLLPPDACHVGLSPANYVLHAEDLDIPQARHRVILLGLAKGVRRGNVGLKPSKAKVSVRQAIGDLPEIRSSPSGPRKTYADWRNAIVDIDRRTVPRDVSARMAELFERMSDLSIGGEYIPTSGGRKSDWLLGHTRKLLDDRLDGVTHHSSRRHMPSDLARYFFAATYMSIKKVSPKLAQYPDALLPAHKNAREAQETILFSDRFRVQGWDRPATTVVSHIAKDGHYYIHPDPLQCRSLTVREAARIQTFPDNYFFEGGRTSQYHQVGNAVPPLLATQIAGVLASILSSAT